MNIAIVGAGFTGLSSAFRLAKNGHKVTVFEKDKKPGGLAVGYQKRGWNWTFEEHYHHWFSKDDAILSLAGEIEYPYKLLRAKTSVYVDGNIYQLDSPFHVLSFQKLSMSDKVRMAMVLALLRINPFWQPLEKVHAHSFLTFAMGETPYKMLWEPQLRNKFGKYYKSVSLAWFWARIQARTPTLAYPEKGYLRFAQALVKEITDMNGDVKFGIEITKITVKGSVKVYEGNTAYMFDKLIFTGSTGLFTKLVPDLPNNYIKKLKRLHTLGAMNLVLRLKKRFMKDGTYWLSVCDSKAPVMAIVEHTNFMNPADFNGEHLVYIGNYLSVTDTRYTMNKKQILALYDPFLRKINNTYKKNLLDIELFKAPFAQPIIPVNYSKMIPSMTTPLAHVYLANMQQVYPWDRGTNYAVELGRKVADVILKES